MDGLDVTVDTGLAARVSIFPCIRPIQLHRDEADVDTKPGQISIGAIHSFVVGI
jgi:hypothetical protein